MREKDIDLSKAVFRDPNHHSREFLVDPTTFQNPDRFNLKEKIILGILHWYCSEEIRFLINLWLDANWGKERLDIKDVVLNSKRTALGWLKVQDEFGDRDFFGNYLQKSLINPFLRLKLRKQNVSSKPKKYSGWCRGPKDQSSTVDNLNSRTKIGKGTEFAVEELQRQLELTLLIESLYDKIEEFYDKSS